MANKQLTASVKLNTSDFERKLKRISRGIDALNKAVGRQSNAYRQVNSALGKADKTTRQVKSSTDRWATSQRKVNVSLKSNNSLLGGISGKLKAIASTYLGIMGMKAMIGTSDILTSTQNKLNTLNGGDTNLTQQQMDKMYASANKVRMAYTDMASNASKSMTLAGEAFNGNMDNAIRFQEIMAETYALGGASAEEMSTSMYQLIQALGAGTLAGDELRSVREGAPLAYKEIEKFAQGIYNSTDSLKDMAAQGMITSEMVVAAVMDAGSRIDEQFDNTAMTFGQAWNRIKNSAVKAFEPVSYMLNDMLNKAADNGAFEKIETAFFNVSKAIQIAFKVIENGVNWIVDNWAVIENVLISGLLTFAGLLAYTAITAVINFIMTYTTLIKIATAVFAIILLFTLWKDGIINTTTALTGLLVIGALIAVFFGGWIVAAILLAVAFVIYFFDIICGVLAAIVAIAWNVLAAILKGLIGAINLIIELVMYCGSVIVNIVIWLLNVVLSVFANIGIGIANCWIGATNAFWNFIGDVLTGLKDLEPAINAIASALGIEGFTLSGAIENVYAKGNKETLSYVNPSDLIPTIDLGKNHDRFGELIGDDWIKWANASNWYNSASGWGSGIMDSVNNWGSGLAGKVDSGIDGFFGDKFNLDEIGKQLGLDFGNLADGFPNSQNSPLDVDDLFSNVGDIANNTGDVADAMELTQQDLEYLRRIADMEWKKEYTTANIKVDMSNYNTVNGDGDLDGIVTRLADKLYEEMQVVADGVYA